MKCQTVKINMNREKNRIKIDMKNFEFSALLSLECGILER